MNNILLKAEAIYLHPNGELYEYAENDFLNILPETVYAAESFAKKKDYEKAAQAFIYVGYIWGETGNKESAMTAFKNAEKYGMLSGDSITTARAQYNIAKLLYYECDYDAARYMSDLADSNYGNNYDEKTYVNNLIANSYIVNKEYDNAEYYLKKSLNYAEAAQSVRAKSMAMNNYSIYYREQGKYNEAIDILHNCLETDSTPTRVLMFNLNIGIIYMYMNQYDSAFNYINKSLELSKLTRTKPETETSIYYYLSYITSVH